MAIVKKFLETRDDGIDLYITYSDEGYFIRKIGTDEIYEEAVDSQKFEYEETDTLIGEEIVTTDEATNQDYIEALERLGVS